MPFIPPPISTVAIVERAEACSEDAELQLTDELRAEYEKRFAMLLANNRAQRQLGAIIARLIRGRERYEAVQAIIGVPWFVTASIHEMECGAADFNCHLHNGDGLQFRTVHVPAGRPIAGNPPFTWEESAVDALTLKGFDVWKDWTIGGTLYKLEDYNGWGYRRKTVATPYLFSGSQWYMNGKFIRDGVWDRHAVSDQIGAAVILRQLSDAGIIAFQHPAETISRCEVP